MDSKEVEQKVTEKGLNAPRVTLAEIEALKNSLIFHTHRFEGTNIMVAVACLPDGFMVGRGFSACVSAANFDYEIGRGVAARNALADADATLWQLEGYALRERLANQPRPLGEILREGE